MATDNRCLKCDSGKLKREIWGYKCSTCGTHENAKLTRVGSLVEIFYIALALVMLHVGIFFMGANWIFLIFAVMFGALVLRYLMCEPSR